jgi:hypothetical protein
MISYSPIWAPHVRGEWTERTYDEDGLPEEQSVTIVCGECKGVHRMKCTSGLAREHVQRFARAHLHRDPMSNAKKGGAA